MTVKNQDTYIIKYLRGKIQAQKREAVLYEQHGLIRDAIKAYYLVLDKCESILSDYMENFTPEVQQNLQLEISQLKRKIRSLKKDLSADDTIHFPNKSATSRSKDFSDKMVLDGPLRVKGDVQKALNEFRRFVDVEHTDSIAEKIKSGETAAVQEKNGIESTRTDTFFDPAFEKKTLGYRISIFLTTHSIFFSVIACCVVLFFLYFIPSVRNVEDVDHFILPHDPDNIFYKHFKQTFGNDEFFIIAFDKEDIFLPENIDLLASITSDLEDIEEIREVESLSNTDLVVGGEDYFEVRQFFEEIPEDIETLQFLKRKAITNRLYVNNLISADAKTTAIVVSAFDRPEDDYYRSRLMSEVEGVLESYSDRVDRFYLAGKTVTDTGMTTYIDRDTTVLVPLCYLLIIVTIFLFYRNIRLVFIAIVNTSVCVACTMGFFGLTGITQNSVTTIVIPLVMALSLCDTVHIFSHLDRRILTVEPDRKQALALALSSVISPCFLTTLTTAIGFLSLYVSDIPPIREFAVTAAMGMVFELFFSFTLMTSMILLNNPQKIYRNHTDEKIMSKCLASLFHFSFKYRKRIIALAGAVTLFSVAAASVVKIETNVTLFFKETSPIRKDLAHIESTLGGVESLDISLISNTEGAFIEPDNLQFVDYLQSKIQAIKGVDVTLSFVDFLKDMNRAFYNDNETYYSIPKSRELVAQYLLLYDSDDIEDFVNSTYDQARISIRISEHNSNQQEAIIRQLKEIIAEEKLPDTDLRVTGRVLQDVNVINSIFWSQIYSLGLAAGIIWLIMFLVLKSFKFGVISSVPNFFPLVLNFGIMGLLGIPLNTATALIATVAIGIAVDDTIHLMSEIHRRYSKGIPIHLAVSSSIQIKGRAIITSSIILCCGFGILGFSSFVPTAYFGILCAGIMLSAIVGDLFFLPSFLFQILPMNGGDNETN